MTVWGLEAESRVGLELVRLARNGQELSLLLDPVLCAAEAC